jgi:hypothetical protein
LTPILKKPNVKQGWQSASSGRAPEALSSNPSTVKTKQKQTKQTVFSIEEMLNKYLLVIE